MPMGDEVSSARLWGDAQKRKTKCIQTIAWYDDLKRRTVGDSASLPKYTIKGTIIIKAIKSTEEDIGCKRN